MNKKVFKEHSVYSPIFDIHYESEASYIEYGPITPKEQKTFGGVYITNKCDHSSIRLMNYQIKKLYPLLKVDSFSIPYQIIDFSTSESKYNSDICIVSQTYDGTVLIFTELDHQMYSHRMWHIPFTIKYTEMMDIFNHVIHFCKE